MRSHSTQSHEWHGNHKSGCEQLGTTLGQWSLEKPDQKSQQDSAGNQLEPLWWALGTSGGSLEPLGPAPVLSALSGAQKLTLAIVALVAVVVFGLWPIVRPKRYNQRQLKRLESNQRLKRELEKHD